MRLPVLTAVSDTKCEAALVRAFESRDLGVTVVRRCVDIADLLAAAAAGTARAVVLSSDLRRLDRAALARLAVARVGVVALVPPGDEAAERRMRQLGIGDVLPADAAPAQVAAVAAGAAAGTASRTPRGAALSDPLRGIADPHVIDSELDELAADLDPSGRLVAVWGPAGAPGRTTVAVNLAAELAQLGHQTLLVDADTYGGSIAQQLGLLDEAPGVAAAARLANAGTLDVPQLANLARQVSPALRVLTGISRPERWPELGGAAIDVVLALARRLVEWTVVDCGFSLEQDEELSYDTATPRRNAATLTALASADMVVAVGGADPVSVQRLVRGLAALADVVPGVDPVVVVNRVRPSLMGGNAEREIAAALERYAGRRPAAFVPADVKAVDAALMAGHWLGESTPTSPARQAVASLARSLAGHPARRRRGVLARRR
ncbi:MAG: P-loop NTPase [Frankia sp.]|nr:P-loop NTPase [Frankia sp.]